MLVLGILIVVGIALMILAEYTHYQLRDNLCRGLRVVWFLLVLYGMWRLVDMEAPLTIAAAIAWAFFNAVIGLITTHATTRYLDRRHKTRPTLWEDWEDT